MLTHLDGMAADGRQMLRAHKDVTNSEEKIKLLQARINVLERKEEQSRKRMHAMEVRAGYIEAAKVKQVNGISVKSKKANYLDLTIAGRLAAPIQRRTKEAPVLSGRAEDQECAAEG